mgnify:CR=1 FL=1
MTQALRLTREVLFIRFNLIITATSAKNGIYILSL